MAKKQVSNSSQEIDIRSALNTEQQVAFLSLWAVNAIVLLILSIILRDNVVLGNDKVPATLAATISGFVLAIVTFLIKPIESKLGFSIKDQNVQTATYFAVSIFCIWIIKRLANITGLGISNLLFVLIVAAGATASFKLVARAVNLFLKKT